MKRSQLIPTLFAVLFAVACYFPLFLHLDHMSVRLWDEARRAVNAFEMAQNGNLIVTYYDGAPEMWGTKPPLLIWCQVFFMKIIGYNEVALRLPSALAALATVMVLVFFSWKVLKRPLAGFLAGLVLLTTKGYVGAHVVRSGDFDSLLTLWETTYLLAFFAFFCQADFTKKKKWLYGMAAFIALAGLTKGIAGFLFLPGILIFYVLFSPRSGEGRRPEFFKLLQWRHTWLAAWVAVAPVAGFYLLREAMNPGYLAAVMDNEVGGRYLVTQGGHAHPWHHYFEWLWREQFQPWLLFLPLALVAGFWEKSRLRNLTGLLLVNSLVFLLILSFAKTRIMWYMAPVYPSLALLVGIGFEKLVTGASQLLRPNATSGQQPPITNYLLLATFVFALFFQPYRAIIDRVYFEQHPEWDWHELKYRDFMRKVKDVKTYTIVHAKYNSHVLFYTKVFNLKGHNIRHQPLKDFDLNKFEFGKGPLKFTAGDTLMVCENPVFAALDTVYRYDVLRAWDSCKLLKINELIGNE